MITGIYEIHNKENNKRYIGQAIDINARWAQHKNELKKGAHNEKLQPDWDKYSEDAFDFNVLIECKKEFLNLYEAYYYS